MTKISMRPPLKSRREALSSGGNSIIWQSTNYQFWREWERQPRQASVIMTTFTTSCLTTRQGAAFDRKPLKSFRPKILVSIMLVGTLHSVSTTMPPSVACTSPCPSSTLLLHVVSCQHCRQRWQQEGNKRACYQRINVFQTEDGCDYNLTSSSSLPNEVRRR
jgi:hypothetical protein